MYRVAIYASDPASKSGRRKINKNSQGGTTAKDAAEMVSKALASVPADQASKIVRILIQTENAGADSGDLKLSFEAPKAGANGGAKKTTKASK